MLGPRTISKSKFQISKIEIKKKAEGTALIV
jgi:hypothetical protein